MPKVLITGGKGQLAQALFDAQFDEKTCYTADQSELDITDPQSIEKYLTEDSFDFIVNCAAYTAVDDAEDHKEEAYKVNADGAANISAYCKRNNIKLIHISTDFVFNGDTDRAYIEVDDPDPVNVYGASKLEGEKRVITENHEAIIIRTSWLYSENGKNFLNTMMRLGKERKEIKVVNDQFGTPTYAADLAKAVLKIIHLPNHWVPGIYHYSNEGQCSWFEFATAIMDIAKLNCRVEPIPSSSYPTPARRPRYSVLNKEKIRQQFKLDIPNWRDSLEKCIKNKKNELARS